MNEQRVLAKFLIVVQLVRVWRKYQGNVGVLIEEAPSLIPHLVGPVNHDDTLPTELGPLEEAMRRIRLEKNLLVVVD